MTLDEMYDEMELYGFEDFDDAQKLTLLNEAYFDVVTREPWPFLEKTVSITVPSGTTKITNNASVSPQITDLNSVLSFNDDTNKIVMIPERADVVEKNYMWAGSTNTPYLYYFVGEDMYIYPGASGQTVYRLYYTRIPTAATTTSDTFLIPARHHSIIVYGALVKAFLVNDDPQASVFQNLFEARYQQMRNDLWVQQYDRTERVHILSDSYDWSY